MIKLKKLLKEASLSPSYNKMYRGWTILHDVLGPQSEEYKNLYMIQFLINGGMLYIEVNQKQ